MKKVALLLAIILLGTVSFAATAEKSSGIPVGKWGFGAQGLTLTSGAITMPTLKFYLNEGMAIEGGVSYLSETNRPTGSADNVMSLMLALKGILGKAPNGIYPQWGISFIYIKNPGFVKDENLMGVALNLGAEYFITPQFSIEGNLSPIAYSSDTLGGNTTTDISIFGSNLIPAAIVGAHLYL